MFYKKLLNSLFLSLTFLLVTTPSYAHLDGDITLKSVLTNKKAKYESANKIVQIITSDDFIKALFDAYKVAIKQHAKEVLSPIVNDTSKIVPYKLSIELSTEAIALLNRTYANNVATRNLVQQLTSLIGDAYVILHSIDMDKKNKTSGLDVLIRCDSFIAKITKLATAANSHASKFKDNKEFQALENRAKDLELQYPETFEKTALYNFLASVLQLSNTQFEQKILEKRQSLKAQGLDHNTIEMIISLYYMWIIQPHPTIENLMNELTSLYTQSGDHQEVDQLITSELVLRYDAFFSAFLAQLLGLANFATTVVHRELALHE